MKFEIDESKIGVIVKTFESRCIIRLFYPMDENGNWIRGEQDEGRAVEWEFLMKCTSYDLFIETISEIKEGLISSIKEREFARLNPDSKWKAFGENNV